MGGFYRRTWVYLGELNGVDLHLSSHTADLFVWIFKAAFYLRGLVFSVVLGVLTNKTFLFSHGLMVS